jgi:hypothetical protein
VHSLLDTDAVVFNRLWQILDQKCSSSKEEAEDCHAGYCALPAEDTAVQ